MSHLGSDGGSLAEQYAARPTLIGCCVMRRVPKNHPATPLLHIALDDCGANTVKDHP
jgi:hypothetical protein